MMGTVVVEWLVLEKKPYNVWSMTLSARKSTPTHYNVGKKSCRSQMAQVPATGPRSRVPMVKSRKSSEVRLVKVIPFRVFRLCEINPCGLCRSSNCRAWNIMA